MNNYQTALNMYRSVGVQTGIEDASDHQLIEMLLDGAISRITSAKSACLRGVISERGENISASIAIIDSLRSSLDLEKGGEIANNLMQLYSYMEIKLAEANLNGDTELLDQVVGLLRELQAGWKGIPRDQR